MNQRRFLWILCFFVSCITFSVFPQSSLFKNKVGYTFQPGDGIRVKVWQLIPEELKSSLSEQLTDDYTIDGDEVQFSRLLEKLK